MDLRRRGVAGLALGCLVAAATAGATAGPAAAAPAATITVDYQQSGPSINPLLYGTNSRYTNNWEGAWDPAADRVRAGFAATYDDIFVNGASGPASLRYPGGTVGNTFRWTWSIGADRRTQVANNASGNPWPGGGLFPSFGLDEVARYAEAHNSRLVYVYNFANGSAADAADLVEYLNAPVGSNPNGGTAWAQVRADNGHRAPYGVRYFEIGNEVGGDGQDYWLHVERYSSEVAQRYADGADGHDGFSRYYSAMNAVAAATGTDIEIFSALGQQTFINVMGADRPYDGLVRHLYANNLPTAADGFHDQAMVEAAGKAAEARELLTSMRSRVGGSRAAGMDVVATEYGVLGGDQNQRQTMTQALYVSKMLLDFMSQDMAFAQKHITTEIDDPVDDDGQWVIGPQSQGFVPSATARAFKLFTHHFGDQLVGHTLDTPERAAAGGGSVKQLQMRASRDGAGNLYLAVVNSNRGQPGGGGAVTAAIDVDGYDPADGAEVFTLNAPSFTSFNTAAEPNRVVIETKSISGVGSGSFVYTFPPHSVTSIKLRR